MIALCKGMVCHRRGMVGAGQRRTCRLGAFARLLGEDTRLLGALA